MRLILGNINFDMVKINGVTRESRLVLGLRGSNYIDSIKPHDPIIDLPKRTSINQRSRPKILIKALISILDLIIDRIERYFLFSKTLMIFYLFYFLQVF